MARSAFTLDEAISKLRAAGSRENRAGMARFGIETDKAFGVSMPDIRAIAKEIEPDHALAETLWQSGFHEARILASLVDRPKWVTPEQMDRWTKDFKPGTSAIRSAAICGTAHPIATKRYTYGRAMNANSSGRRLRHHCLARRPRQKGR